MQVVVGQAEAVVSGAESPVPIFVFGTLSAVELHDPVAPELLHELFRCACRPQGVVHLDEIGVLSEHVQLELFLGSEKRDQMVETVYLAASEYQLMVLEQIDTVFVDIDLQRGGVRMLGQLVVIRECYDVISEFPVGFIGLGRPILAFVQDTFYACMGVEIGPFPAKCRVIPQPAVRVEDVRPAEWSGLAEIIYGTYACRKDCQKGNQDKGCHCLKQCDRYLS